MRLVFVGPPGAGKGTQAKVICAKWGIPQISTGDLLRANVNEKTELGKIAKEIMGRGELVPDTLVNEMVAERLQAPDTANGYILDGFPRTLPQAVALDNMLRAKGLALDAVLELRVDEAALIKRIETRVAQMSARGEALREDDNANVLRTRLKTYREQTAPLIAHYRQQGILRTVNGMAPIENVAAEIDQVLRSKMPARAGSA